MSQVVQALVFIDANVTDVAHLLHGVRPGYQAHVLAPDRNGVEQITKVLQSTPAREVHIISHGAPGSLFLGNSALNLDTLERYSQSLQTWFQNPATLYLYGCNVAAGDAGAEFLAKLHNLTGAAIAASTSRVGNAELGGSWNLDVAINSVVQPKALVPDAQESYVGVFVNLTQSGSTEIPDNNTNGIEITFAVSGEDAQAVVSDITLALKIDHIQRGDLQVELESPDGTVVQLIAVASADGFDNYDLLLTDDPASSGLTTTLINDGNNDTLADPIDRDAAPTEPFSTFNGKTANGNWILRIKDLDTNGVAGSFEQATLSLSTQIITNEAPIFDAVPDPVQFSENSTADVITVTVTDADTDAIQFLALEGEDAASFTLADNGDGTATIAPNAAIDLEDGASFDGDDTYEVIVRATDGKVANPTEQLINIAIQNVNDQPTGSVSITSGGVGFQAGDTLAADTSAVSDQDGLTTANFSYDWQTSTDGVAGWTSIGAPDQATYTLTSGDVDNYLRVVVSYTDDGTFSNTVESSATQQIAGIPNDPPVFDAVAPNDFVENSTNVAVTVNATDSDTPVVYSLDDTVGDNALFDVNVSGEVTFTAAPDFENPLDANQDNNYEVQVQATDNLGASSTQNITITVIDGNDTPVNQGSILNTTVTTPEDTGYVFSSANDNAITVDDPDVGEILRVVLSVPQGLGTIALGDTTGITVINNNTNVVTITGATQEQVNTALEGLTFTPPGDFTGSITLTINTADTEQLSDTDTVTFTVENVNDPAGIGGDLSGTIVEGSIESDTGTVTVTETGSDLVAGDLAAIVSPGATVLGDYGTFSIVNGTWTYSYTGELREGESKADSFTITADDGTTETVTINITGTNDEPIITGDTTVSGLVEDNTSFATGNLTISDDDGEVEEAFNIISDQSGTYGFFSISETGTWTYILDNSREVTKALASTETVQDTFTIETADGTTREFIVNIQGTNDAPSITGSFGGTVKEETTLSATGSLTVEDIDNGESFFNPIVSTDAAAAGTYGTFTIDANGNWDYTLDNTAAVNPLSEGEQVFDTFTVSTLDGSSRTVTITVEGTNDNAVIFLDTGDSKAETIAENDTTVVNGALSVTDDDNGEAVFQPIASTDAASQGTYGTFTINANGIWSYTLTEPLDSLPAGQSEVDSFTVTSKDGSATETVTITIDGLNNPAQISSTGAGETKTGEVTEDVKFTATGKLSVSDVDTGEAAFQAVTGGTTANGYGTFDIDAAGNWTYNLDNTLSAVQELGSQETLTDTFVVTSEDTGTSETVTITIRGTNDSPEVSAGITASASEDDASTLTIDLLQGATDVDSTNLSIANLDPSTAVDGIQVVGNTLEVTPSAYNSLQEGEPATITYTYDIVDDAGGSVAQTATITINGVNDAPDVTSEGTSDLEETVTEDDAAFSVDLTRIATDPDTGDVLQATFINPVPGTDDRGVTINGNLLEVDPTAYNFLGGGQPEVIEYTYRITDGTATVTNLTASITITGVNDAPDIGGDVTGEVTENNDASVADLTASGNLTITDADTGEAVFVGETLTGTYGELTIGTDGAWNYTVANDATIDALGAGDTLTDSFNVTSADGTTQSIDITIKGTDDVGTLADPSQLSATIAEDTFANTLVVNKQLTLNDPDTGEGSFVAETKQGQYGTLTIGTDGLWEYSASNNQTAIQELSGPLGTAPAETLVETFEVQSDDGNVFNIDVTITGVDDAPTFSGDKTGEVTEDTDVDTSDFLVASGTLTVTDTDSGESQFVVDPVAGVATYTGTYGTLTIDASGTWEYKADNTQQAIQDLAANETVTDEFTAVQSIDGSTETITITINGTSGPATISGTTTGSVTEDLSVVSGFLETTGVINVSDEDTGESEFSTTVTPINGARGTLTIGATDPATGDATWTYQVDNTLVQDLDVDDNPTYTESFTISTADGTEETITITINGAEDIPEFSGDLSGQVTEDAIVTDETSVDFGKLLDTGTLTATDADAGESLFVATSYTGTYGTLTIDANGDWKYVANNEQTAIQELDAAAAPLVDTFDAIETIDGTTLATATTPVSLDIEITGVDDPASISSNETDETKTGNIGEDDTTAVTGKMTVIDEDAGESLFQVVTDQPGDNPAGYGTFSIDDQGNWSYALINGQPSDPVQSLTEGETATDTYTFTSLDGSATETVEVTITGVNDLATISSTGTGETKTGSVAEDGTLQISGLLSVSDVDAGEDEFQPIASTDVEAEGTYGTFTIDATGNWTYELDNVKVQGLTSADTPTDTFTVTSEDGSATETVTIDITGADDVPIFGGDSTGEVVEDTAVTTINNVAYLTASGQLTATDNDDNQSGFTATTTPLSGSIGGELTIDANGNWDYKIDTSLGTIQALSENSPSLTEEFTVESLDGTPTTISITIKGSDDEAQIVGNPDQSAFSGLVVEDDPTAATASADLNVIDVDSADQDFNVIDRQAGLYGTFSIDTAGTWTYELDNTLAATSRLTENDIKTETFTVSIPDGTQKNVSITVVGANDAPTGTLTGSLNISATEDVDIPNIPRTTFTSGITDAEGDPLTIQQDGTTPFIDPAQGELVDNGNGTFTFRPADNYNGEVTVNYVVSDGITTSGLITKTFNVAAVNDAPTSSTGPTGTLVDIDEDTQNVFSVSDLTAGFTDIDGDDLSVSNLRANGSTNTIVNNNGIITYTPPENFSGPVEITYTVIDGNGGSVSGQSLSFNVNEVNDVPTGTPEGVIPDTEEDTAFDIELTTLLAGFTDVDGDPLEITSIFVDVGTISPVGDGLGPFTYTPPEDFSGSVEVTYSFSDGRGGTISNQKLTFDVTPVNDAPVFVGPEGVIADGLEDEPLTIQASTLLQGFEDVDNDTLSIQALVPSLGTEANIVNNGDGTYTYTPPENANGEVTLTYNVTDGSANGIVENVTRTFTLTAVNDAPVGSSEADLGPVDENTDLTILNSELLAGFSDPDEAEGDTLSVTNPTVATTGAGILTATTDGYTFTPTTGYNGSVTIDYTVTDGQEDVAGSLTFQVEPINDLPGGSVFIKTVDPTIVVKQGAELVVDTTGLTDPDGLTSVSFDSYQWQIAPPNPQESDWQDITGAMAATYTPTNAEVGSVLRVIIGYTDDAGFSNTVTSDPSAQVADVNDAPTGSPTGTIPTGTEDTEQVIASATLLEGFSDPDVNDTLTVSAVTVPSEQGTIVAENGDFKFTPAANYFGEVTLTYTVTDGEATIEGNTLTFTLEAVNDAPTVAEPIVRTVTEDDAKFTIKLLSGATDIEGNTLTVENLTPAELPTGVTFANNVLTVDPAVYDSLATDASEVLNFSYNIVDGAGGSVAQTATVTITGVNDAPEGSATAELLPSLQDAQRLISPTVLLEGFTDPDGDELVVEGVTASSGSVTVGENGNFVYKPAEGFVGDVTLTYNVSDGAASVTGTQTFELKSDQVPPNVFNFQQFVQFNAIDEGVGYVGPSLATEIGGITLSAIYDENYYLSQYSDIAAAVELGTLSSGFQHFVNVGYLEGRNPSLYYNEGVYLRTNSDVRAAVEAGDFSSGLQHFLLFGHAENRTASNFFDSSDYILNNPDVANAVTNGDFRSGFEHFVEFGASEGRAPALLFVEQYYLDQNPDVAAAVESGGFSSGFEHYVAFGQKEITRDPSPLFDESDYLGSNPDVAAAVEAGAFSSGFEHFLRFGRAEGRPQFTPETFEV